MACELKRQVGANNKRWSVAVADFIDREGTPRKAERHAPFMVLKENARPAEDIEGDACRPHDAATNHSHERSLRLPSGRTKALASRFG